MVFPSPPPPPHLSYQRVLSSLCPKQHLSTNHHSVATTSVQTTIIFGLEGHNNLSPSFYFSLPPTQFTLHTAVNVRLCVKPFNGLMTSLHSLTQSCMPCPCLPPHITPILFPGLAILVTLTFLQLLTHPKLAYLFPGLGTY